ncbi:hypothetical protein [Actinoallomurus sp. NPDC052274]|uniref:SbtR family transcriptional regulator n=1 Tax=Actinoallomurus sp. NPDC052274 TaxID=3155420 RepID=UPI00341EDF06
MKRPPVSATPALMVVPGGKVREECLPLPDTRQALAGFLARIGRVHEEERGVSSAIEAALGDTEPRGQVGADLLAVGAELLERGRSDGTLRPDAEVADL